MNNKKNKALSILILICVAAMTYGQSPQETMRQMNDIKLDNAFLKAQYTHAIEDSAYMMGAQDLTRQVTSQTGQHYTLAQLTPHFQKLTIKRGSSHMVLVYVRKSDISPSQPGVTLLDDKQKVQNTNEHLQPQQDAQTPPITMPISGIVREIMAGNDAEEVWKMFNIKKRNGEIKGFGPCKNISNIDALFLSIFDGETQKPKAVLSPQKDGVRTNLVTNSPDDFSNYHGTYAIWFTLNNQ